MAVLHVQMALFMLHELTVGQVNRSCRNLYVLGHLLQYGSDALDPAAAQSGASLTAAAALDTIITLFRQNTGYSCVLLMKDAAVLTSDQLMPCSACRICPGRLFFLFFRVLIHSRAN